MTGMFSSLDLIRGIGLSCIKLNMSVRMGKFFAAIAALVGRLLFLGNSFASVARISVLLTYDLCKRMRPPTVYSSYALTFTVYERDWWVHCPGEPVFQLFLGFCQGPQSVWELPLTRLT